MYEGGAGGFSFYTRDGEQIVRQRKNNSNYGESASRTHAQMVRRVKWANLVNVFKAMKTWQPSAYEYKAKGQTDYNIFMSLNINSASAALTKDQANNGCAVMDAYQISRGSLPPITTAWNGSRDDWRTDIVITAAITAATTVGALSSDIIANNPQFLNGDNIAIVAFSQFVDSRQYPYVVSVYNELTLDKDSSVLVNTLPLWNWLSTADTQFLSIAQPGSSFGAYSHAAAIHTRKADSLMVSTQNLVASPASVVANYSGDEWVDECIDTYGLDTEVPLTPSFHRASVQSITANGSAISPGAALTGQQVIRVTGSGLYAPALRFVYDGIDYTPLSRGANWVEYIITSSGNAVVYVNGAESLRFSVSGITPPSELSGYIQGVQQNEVAYTADFYNLQSSNSACLNYPYMVSPDLMYFRLVMDVVDKEAIQQSDYSFVNCSSVDYSPVAVSERIAITLQLTDPTSVCYLAYKGFIIFVGNYS